MATIFLGSEGILLIDYPEHSRTITETYYSDLIRKCWATLKEKRRGNFVMHHAECCFIRAKHLLTRHHKHWLPFEMQALNCSTTHRICQIWPIFGPQWLLVSRTEWILERTEICWWRWCYLHRKWLAGGPRTIILLQWNTGLGESLHFCWRELCWKAVCLNTANHCKSLQITANQPQITAWILQITANHRKSTANHCKSPQMTANQWQMQQKYRYELLLINGRNGIAGTCRGRLLTHSHTVTNQAYGQWSLRKTRIFYTRSSCVITAGATDSPAMALLSQCPTMAVANQPPTTTLTSQATQTSSHDDIKERSLLHSGNCQSGS